MNQYCTRIPRHPRARLSRRVAILLVASIAALSARSQTIRISEVVANPNENQGGRHAAEFVELVNIGAEPIDLTGWRIADEQSTDDIQPFQPGGSMILQPNMFAIILDPDNEGQYDIPTDAIVLRPSNSAIGNSLALKEIVTLLDPTGAIADTHTPPMAARHGTSFERIDLQGPDEPQNWQLCTDRSGTTIGRPTSPRRPPPQPPQEPPKLKGMIRLSEIMFRPKTDAPEWVEILNRSDSAITMSAWTLSDQRDQPVLIPVGTIPAKGRAILTQNTADFRAEHPDTPEPTLIVEMPLPTLGDAGDTITLRDGTETILDRVTYGSFVPDRGQSLERRDADTESSRMDNWLLSVALAGSTPGGPNSVQHETGPQPLIQAIPNPFDPIAGVQLRFEAPIKSRVTLRVLDHDGKVVRTILDNARNAGRQRIAWDGKDVDGEAVANGVYTVLLVTESDGEPKTASVAITAQRVAADPPQPPSN